MALALTVGWGLGARRSRDGWCRTAVRAGVIAALALAQMVVFAAREARRSPHEPSRRDD